MTKLTIAVAVVGLFGAAALCAAEKPVKVELKDAKGESVGTAMIAAAKGGSGVTIALNLKNLTPGEHALHFHQNAKCEAPGFTTAGGHVNPASAHHGVNNPETPHPHAGDMENFTVGADGTAKKTIKNANVTMGDSAN